MIFQRLNRSDPERIFIVVQNNEGAAINKDQTVQWELASASIDGVKVRDMDTANDYAFAGIADAAIANGEFGLLQVYGYRSSSIVFQTGTSVATGVPLVAVAAQDYLNSVLSTFASNTSVTLHNIVAVLGESITDATASGTVSRKIFIRAL